MIHLPHSSDLTGCETTEARASALYPGLTFDTTLPQHWVDFLYASGFDPRYQVVWGYPQGNLFGQPYPLTVEAMLALAARVR